MDHTEIIDATYQAAARSELWSAKLCSIVDYVGAVAGNVLYQAPGSQGSFLIPGRMRDDLNTLYLEHDTGNPYARAFQECQTRPDRRGDNLIDAVAVRRLAFYADICAPQNIFSQLFLPHASLHERGGIGGIALFLSQRQDEDVAAAAMRLKLLATHVARAIDLCIHTRQIAKGPDLAQRLIDAMADAAIEACSISSGI